MLKLFLRKILWPPHWLRAYSASRNRVVTSRAALDPQLKLYDQILKTDFLHYGYFDDAEISADKISFADIRAAQFRYAELILEQMDNFEDPVLDVGCGMGGLMRMLLEKGLPVTGVTPDKVQVEYIREKYPQADLVRAKFQKMETQEYRAHFATIIHSESLQYINLDAAIKNVLEMLAQDGNWIVVDYFRTGETHEKSGHQWVQFLEKLTQNNLEIVYEQDITRNIRPTLDYVYMWGGQIGKPVFNFLVEKLQVKHPGKHYLLEEVIEKLETKIDKNLKTVNPEEFSKGKKYVLLKIKRVA